MQIENKEVSLGKPVWHWAVAGVAAVAAIILWFSHSGKPTVSGKDSFTSSMVTKSADSAIEMVSLSNESIVRSGIAVIPVQLQAFRKEITTVGVLEIPEPSERTIAARARERMYVATTGTYVRKGEPLYTFYSPDILNAEQEFLIAKQNVSTIGHEAVVKMPGMEHGYSNAGLIEAGKKRLKLYGLMDYQIMALERDGEVANTVTIRAPDSGLILQKLSQEGAYVDEGTNIFQLADLSSVWAEVDVPESAIRFIRLGQSITIQTEAYPNENFTGKVIFISPVEDQSSRTIRVRAALPNPAYKLRPQMTFTSNIEINLGHTLAIPASAVIRTGTGDFVWVRDTGTMFTSHKVKLGARSPDDYYQVLAGLEAGEEVAAQGAFLIDAEYQFTENNPMATMNMGPANGAGKTLGEGMGTVRSIDFTHQTITLDHGTIPGVMPGMTMAYKISDSKFLNTVRVTEVVRFTLTRMENGEYEITAIAKQ